MHLNRAHSFSNLRQVQDELSAFVMELAPPELDPGTQVPFLSIGANDGSVGERSERCRGRSQFSGGNLLITELSSEDAGNYR